MRNDYPVAWHFHSNTARWPHNMRSMPTEPCPAAPFKEYLDAPLTPLPDADPSRVALQDAVSRRLSCRRFSGSEITLHELSALLASGYGVEGKLVVGPSEFVERPVPSGGGLYPLELYVMAKAVEGIQQGIYHYAPIPHGLETLSPVALPDSVLSSLFLGQTYLTVAAAVIVICAVWERTFWKYGDRGYRYVLLEAGHAAQNLNLVSVALGLGSFNLGGFFDADLSRCLGLDAEEEAPVYGVAVGRPLTSDRTEARQPPGEPPAIELGGRGQ